MSSNCCETLKAELSEVKALLAMLSGKYATKAELDSARAGLRAEIAQTKSILEAAIDALRDLLSSAIDGVRRIADLAISVAQKAFQLAQEVARKIFEILNGIAALGGLSNRLAVLEAEIGRLKGYVNDAMQKVGQALRASFEAKQAANFALQTANTANKKAETAIILSRDAMRSAKIAQEKAENALSKANQALDLANGVRKRLDGLESIARLALSTANSATNRIKSLENRVGSLEQKVLKALAFAELALAQSTVARIAAFAALKASAFATAQALSAQAKANAASAVAARALNMATDAKRLASSAIEIANRALGIAELASGKANSAIDKAISASNKAQEALSLAQFVKELLEDLERKIKRQDQLDNQLLGKILQAVDRLSESIGKTSKAIGTDRFPAYVPETLIVKESGFLPDIFGNSDANRTKKIDNLADLFAWYVIQFEGMIGKFHQVVTIEDIDPTRRGNQTEKIVLPNIAETLAEIVSLSVTTRVNTEALLTVGMRALIESGLAKQEAIKAGQFAKANADFLNYKGKETDIDIPMTFTPPRTTEGADDRNDLVKILRPTRVRAKGFQLDDERDFTVYMTELLQSAAIIRALFYQSFDKDVDIKKQLIDLLKRANKFNDEGTGKREEATSDSNFNTLLERIEKGYIDAPGISDTTNPYGREYAQRPYIREIGKDFTKGTPQDDGLG